MEGWRADGSVEDAVSWWCGHGRARRAAARSHAVSVPSVLRDSAAWPEGLQPTASVNRVIDNKKCRVSRLGGPAGVLSTDVAGRWAQRRDKSHPPVDLGCVSRRYG